MSTMSRYSSSSWFQIQNSNLELFWFLWWSWSCSLVLWFVCVKWKMILQDSRLSTLGPVVSGCQVCTFTLDKKDVPKPTEMKSLLKIIHLLKEKHRKWSGTQPDICLVSQDGSTVFTQRLTKYHDYHHPPHHFYHHIIPIITITVDMHWIFFRQSIYILPCLTRWLQSAVRSEVDKVQSSRSPLSQSSPSSALSWSDHPLYHNRYSVSILLTPLKVGIHHSNFSTDGF